MKIIIAGAGEVGTHLAKMLSNEDQDIILLDNDQKRLDIIDSNYNLMTWNGSTSSLETMRDMGMAQTDLFIAVTPFETKNITACAIARRLGARKSVARVDNAEFLIPGNRQVLSAMGVDVLIYPENLAAREIATALTHNWTRYWGELHNGELLLIGVRIHADTPIVGRHLYELPGDVHNYHVVAIKRNAETIIPRGRDTVEVDDILYFITTPKYVSQVRDVCGKVQRNIKRIFIVGGSPIALRFALLYSKKFHIKIIDMDRENCEQMATMLPDCEIVYGDGRDIDVLRENNVYQSDAFLSLTDSSETNILTCLTAKEFGVAKTIADVENIQFISSAENLNIGTVINKKLLASSYIFQLLLDADVENAKCLALANADAAELTVNEGSKITKSRVRDLNFPEGMTLAALARDGVCHLINGDSQIQAGDSVVVFCLHGSLHKIERWFL